MEKDILLFKIDAYTPHTLPMARLAEYLTQLSVLLGSRESVHFEKILKGSVVVQASVQTTESTRVVTRIRSAPTDNAPDDVKRAYQKIDAMLRDNGATGEIKYKGGAKIIAFPGRKLPEPKAIVVSEHTEVDGVIVRVGGTDNTIPVHLQAVNGETFPCQVRDKGLARQLASYIYGEPIRVRGRGEWERTPDGVWKLQTMTIEGWDLLDQTPITGFFEQLRAIPGNGWKTHPNVDQELRRIREGK